MPPPVRATVRALPAALLLGLFVPAPGLAQQADDRADFPPTGPEFVGPPLPPLYDEARLQRMLEEADALPAISSLLVARRDSAVSG